MLVSQSCSNIQHAPQLEPYQEDPLLTLLVHEISNRSLNISFVVECKADHLAILQNKFPERKIVQAPRRGALPGVIVRLIPEIISTSKDSAVVEITTTREGHMLKKRYHLSRPGAGRWTIITSDVVLLH